MKLITTHSIFVGSLALAAWGCTATTDVEPTEKKTGNAEDPCASANDILTDSRCSKTWDSEFCSLGAATNDFYKCGIDLPEHVPPKPKTCTLGEECGTLVVPSLEPWCVERNAQGECTCWSNTNEGSCGTKAIPPSDPLNPD